MIKIKGEVKCSQHNEQIHNFSEGNKIARTPQSYIQYIHLQDIAKTKKLSTRLDGARGAQHVTWALLASNWVQTWVPLTCWRHKYQPEESCGCCRDRTRIVLSMGMWMSLLQLKRARARSSANHKRGFFWIANQERSSTQQVATARTNKKYCSDIVRSGRYKPTSTHCNPQLIAI